MRAKIALSCALAFLPVAGSGAVVINASTQIVFDRAEPAPLQKAAADLSADFRRVFGRRGVITGGAASGATTIRIALDKNSQKPSGWETFRIQASPSSILLTGSDLRGAIYAVYQFSQQFL